MPTKRPRLALDDQANAPSAPARVLLLSVPIEILAEILLYTCSPPTVLAVSRTCSFLYRSLAENPDASFIWRGVRKTCKPDQLPDPGDGWKKSEADYAAFVFGGGICEMCRKKTREMYLSFSARIRLCGSWHCRRKFLDDVLVNVTSQLLGRDRELLWVPPVESTRCFYPCRMGALIWPRGEVMLRKSDWEQFRCDLQAYKNAELARALGKGCEQTERVLERCRAALRRYPQIMEVSERLIQWKWKYERTYRETKKLNKLQTRNLVGMEGWDLEDLVATQTFGSLRRRRNLLLEVIRMKDVIPIRSTIERELLALKARHQRQKAEASYNTRLTEVKKIYERMRSGTLGTCDLESSCSSDPFALPPLSVFCVLPSVRALKGSPDPSALAFDSSPTSEMNSPFAISLVMADVHTWLVPVKKRLMTLLGYPDGWQSANRRAVHPLKRTTAQFLCLWCGEGKVGKAYRRKLCLDFAGVCSHVCRNVEEHHQEAPQNGRAVANAGDGQGGKKSSGKVPDWTVEVFVRDDKAIAVTRAIINLLGLPEESSSIGAVLKDQGISIRCMTCKGWIVMDFDTALGHAHRHEAMQVQLLYTPVPRGAGLFQKDGRIPVEEGYRDFPVERLAFERGNTELLLGPSRGAKSLCKKVNYGCKHCLECLEPIVGMEKPRNKGLRAMTFNGLRSHVKEKHDIQDVRDEDFFCYTSIQKERREKR